LKLIGLTGGVGSGKSTVADMLRELGAEVVDADQATHAAYAPGSAGFDSVVREFGPDYAREGSIDRARLGELVFHDDDARRRLNAIVHPLVREWMARRTGEAAERGAEIVVHEVPLLFENGLEAMYEEVILVYVPAAVQLERLVSGRGVPKDRAKAMVAAQMPMDEKRRVARFVVDNSGTREETREQLKRLWDDVLVR